MTSLTTLSLTGSSAVLLSSLEVSSLVVAGFVSVFSGVFTVSESLGLVVVGVVTGVSVGFAGSVTVSDVLGLVTVGVVAGVSVFGVESSL